MQTINNLGIQPASRFDPLDSRQEGNKNTKFADLLIDGQSLYRMLQKHDLVPVFGWGSLEWQQQFLDYFLRGKPHDVLGDRYPLMVCPWCGDEECGFISVKVNREGDRVIWQDFYLEHRREKLPLGPFVFQWAPYEQAIDSTFGMYGIQ